MKIESISYEKLLLDPENPRFGRSKRGNEQQQLLEAIVSTGIEELMKAIGENDFFPGEPLLAFRSSQSSDRYTVLEGNRRLAAVLLLNQPERLDRPDQATAYRRIADIAEHATHKPTDLPVAVVNGRSEVLVYLGYRHVTGVKPWEPLAKARYMRKLFDQASARELDGKYREVAKEIGSRRHHVKRTLNALEFYDFVEKQEFFAIKNLSESTLGFSLITTAFGSEKLFRHVTDADDLVLPGSKLKENEAEEFTRWIFEARDDGPKRVPESRDLQKLAEVVACPESLQAFRDGASLEDAYAKTKGGQEEFRKRMWEISSDLKHAAGLMIAIDRPTESSIGPAREVLKHAQSIIRYLDSRSREDEDS